MCRVPAMHSRTTGWSAVCFDNKKSDPSPLVKHCPRLGHVKVFLAGITVGVQTIVFLPGVQQSVPAFLISCRGTCQAPVFLRIPKPDGEGRSVATFAQVSLVDGRLRGLEGRSYPARHSQIASFAARCGWKRRSPLT